MFWFNLIICWLKISIMVICDTEILGQALLHHTHLIFLTVGRPRRFGWTT